MKSLVEQIETLITPSLSSMGFNLVKVTFMDGKKKPDAADHGRTYRRHHDGG